MEENILYKINEFLNTKSEEALFEHYKLSQEKKDKYAEGFYTQNPKPNEEFDGYGLRYDADYLGNLGTNILISPVEYMANYVDAVTKSTIDENEDVSYLGIDIESDITKEQFSRLNATACGNMAYVYLHTKDKDVKEYTRRNLINIHKWKVEEIIDYLKQIQN